MTAARGRPARDPVGFVRSLWDTHAPLALLGAVMALATVFFVVGI